MKRIPSFSVFFAILLALPAEASLFATDGTELACGQVIQTRFNRDDAEDQVIGPLRAQYPNLCEDPAGLDPAPSLTEEVFIGGFSAATTLAGRELNCDDDINLMINAWINGRWRKREVAQSVALVFPTLCGTENPQNPTVETTRGDVLDCDDMMQLKIKLSIQNRLSSKKLEDQVHRFLPMLCGDRVTLSQCEDRIDNDGDGEIDMMDFGCDSPDDNDETDPAPVYQCSDGIDNDGDGEIDLADDGCDSATDDDETDPAPVYQCSDGIDNDGDGEIDLADDGCDSATDDDET
ncbi:MAG: hypothetical protein QNJ40_21610, partial [Xanthomonadales bacterium]|nr:hypothetical protein [Xanthomonadales bacterium]